MIFDLWLTLIPFPPDVRAEAFEAMCVALRCEPSDLAPHWKASRRQRETSDLREHLIDLGNSLGAEWSKETISTAIAARSASHGVCFARPFPDGAETIRELRERGIAVGLISNCSSEVRESLTAHGMHRWFDQLVLSAEAGVMKPDPEIYLTATRLLGVTPEECLFVGDGSDNELDGATTVGMTAVRYDPTSQQTRADTITVSSHLQLLELLEPH